MITRFFEHFLATAIVSTIAATLTAQEAIAWPSPTFREVEPGVWRGGLPRKNGLKRLKRMGVRTVVDLMDEDSQKWQKLCGELAMRYENIPLHRTEPIPRDSIKRFLSIIEDPSNKPIYVHCRSGRDRTGAMIAIYRIHMNDWTAQKARKEMNSKGFNPMFFHLTKSVDAFERDRRKGQYVD